ncbi:hypothetical protein F0562_013741 [Nyssa sinensis]|uniref:Zinc finger PMZ-type domain-containing protein n=1 Tax=Nyssa sinensis TaxID=561372 RepID=A0A5J4ZLK4_9ASTE|nr:hypothetical protein F0562_013741 [Nyssa sinensis]
MFVQTDKDVLHMFGMYKTKFEIPFYVDVFGFGDEYDVVCTIAPPLLLKGVGSNNLGDKHDKRTKVDVEAGRGTGDWGIDETEVRSDNDNSDFEFELEENQSEDELSNYDSDKSVNSLSELNGSDIDLMSNPKGLDPTKFGDEFHVKEGEAFDFHVDEEKSFVVHLGKKECVSREWNLTGIPCKHASTDVSYKRLNLEEYCDLCYSKETYLAAHRGIIHPIIDHFMWTLATGDLVQPPSLRRLLVRPKKEREKKQMKQLQENSRGTRQLDASSAKDLATTKKHAKGHLWQLGEEAGIPQLLVTYSK